MWRFPLEKKKRWTRTSQNQVPCYVGKLKRLEEKRLHCGCSWSWDRYVLSRNVGKELPLHSAKYSRKAQITVALRCNIVSYYYYHAAKREYFECSIIILRCSSTILIFPFETIILGRFQVRFHVMSNMKLMRIIIKEPVPASYKVPVFPV